MRRNIIRIIALGLLLLAGSTAVVGGCLPVPLCPPGQPGPCIR